MLRLGRGVIRIGRQFTNQGYLDDFTRIYPVVYALDLVCNIGFALLFISTNIKPKSVIAFMPVNLCR